MSASSSVYLPLLSHMLLLAAKLKDSSMAGDVTVVPAPVVISFET